MAKIEKNLRGTEIEFLVRSGNKTIFRAPTFEECDEFLHPKPKCRNKKSKSKKKSNKKKQ